jgi:hypothetical protein
MLLREGHVDNWDGFLGVTSRNVWQVEKHQTLCGLLNADRLIVSQFCTLNNKYEWVVHGLLFCNRHVYMCLVAAFMSEMSGHMGEALHGIEIEKLMIVHRIY